MAITSVRLSPQNQEIIANAALKLRRSKSWVINEAVRVMHQQQQQSEQRWQDTLAALHQVEQGQTVSGDAVHAWLATWGAPGEQQTPQLEP